MGAMIVVDAFWGDSGKGKIGAFLGQKHRAAYCVRAGTGTNAGHSIYFEDGREIKTNQLPCGFLWPASQLRVGSGVAVDVNKLLAEIDRLETQYRVRERVRVDLRCPIITPEYIAREADGHHFAQIGSTASGTGVTLAEFRLRQATQARAIPALTSYLADVPTEINAACAAGDTIIIEGSQGTHLSLALSKDYPYCTSDNCTAVAFADDVGLNWRHIQEVVLIVKAVPSRVGAGALPDELPIEVQDARGIAEYGVTTGRRRRKAERIPWELLDEAVMLNGPTQIALTFCDHFDPAVKGVRAQAELPATVRQLIDQLETRTNVPVTMVETGKYFEDIIDLQP